MRATGTDGPSAVVVGVPDRWTCVTPSRKLVPRLRPSKPSLRSCAGHGAARRLGVFQVVWLRAGRDAASPARMLAGQSLTRYMPA
jgi:hypothetical protein